MWNIKTTFVDSHFEKSNFFKLSFVTTDNTVLFITMFTGCMNINPFLILVQFHIGHLYEMQNKCQNARETYEAVAQSENVPNDVKSNVYKQLGKSHFILNERITTSICSRGFELHSRQGIIKITIVRYWIHFLNVIFWSFKLY